MLQNLPQNEFVVIDGLLLCEVGGQTTVEILFGEVNPSGRLPITYPKATGNVMILYRHRVTKECECARCNGTLARGSVTPTSRTRT